MADYNGLRRKAIATSEIAAYRPTGPTVLGPGNETVMDFVFRKVRTLVENDPSIPEDLQGRVIDSAKKEDMLLIQGKGIDGMVRKAKDEILGGMWKKEAIEGRPVIIGVQPAPQIFIPKNDIEVPSLKIEISDKTLRKRMKFVLDAIARGRGISSQAINNLLPFLLTQNQSRIVLPGNMPKARKEFAAMCALMHHVIEIKTAARTGGNVKAACWSQSQRQLIECIKTVDTDDHLVRHQLGIIATESPFKKVRNAAYRALNG